MGVVSRYGWTLFALAGLAVALAAFEVAFLYSGAG